MHIWGSFEANRFIIYAGAHNVRHIWRSFEADRFIISHELGDIIGDHLLGSFKWVSYFSSIASRPEVPGYVIAQLKFRFNPGVFFYQNRASIQECSHQRRFFSAVSLYCFLRNKGSAHGKNKSATQDRARWGLVPRVPPTSSWVLQDHTGIWLLWKAHQF